MNTFQHDPTETRHKSTKASEGPKHRTIIIVMAAMLLIGILATVLAPFWSILSLSTEIDSEPLGSGVADLPIAPEIGARAPAFELFGIYGRKVSNTDLMGRPMFISFFHSW